MCSSKGKLKYWTIAIKASGLGGRLEPEVTGFPEGMKMSVRRGPADEGRFRTEFLKGTFSASNRSANIVAAGSDFSLLLSEHKKNEAKERFQKERAEFFKARNDKDPEKKALETTIPERVYREVMTDDQGLLVVYLMDLHNVYLQDAGNKAKSDPAMAKVVADNGINLDIPLIGYAIGFPPVSSDPGGEYVHGDYQLEDEEPAEEWDAATLDNNED